jgi:hypothetical protein
VRKILKIKKEATEENEHALSHSFAGWRIP